jgi:pimeloyl-[acyl-carrier protein] methyl ester esterase
MLVLLPGMHGTAELFQDLIKALPSTITTEAVGYPSDRFLSYAQLTALAARSIPSSEPFVLLAESFSTPLAIQLAANNHPNLKGLILCAGFATSPIRGWKRRLYSAFAPGVFRLPTPTWVLDLLIGPNPPLALQIAVRSTISSVTPSVLAARLRAILDCDARADLAKVTVPILYLQAKQDRLIPTSCLEEIRQIVPKIAIATIPGPHLLLQRETAGSAEIVANFVLQRLSEKVK